MAIFTRGLLLLGAAAVAVTTGSGRDSDIVKTPVTPNQVEAYLTPDELAWIRPGLEISIENVTIPEDRKPLVEVAFVDDKDQPLDRAGVLTPGPISISFVLAWYDGGLRQFTSYTTREVTSPITGVKTKQAAADSGGTWTDLEIGRATYKFKTTLPADFDRTKTHTLAVYGTRNLLTELGKSYYSNVEEDFRPDGGVVSEVWHGFEDSTCNSCHDPLSAHGGSRQHVKLCATCHSPQTIDPDTGHTMDLKVMVHKIHMGHLLPSVEAGTPYVIIGHLQSEHDYSTVAYPQDIRNCVGCHRSENGAEGSIWYSRPTRAACGSCHDDVNFATGENHIPIPLTDDALCAACHQPDSGSEGDVSVVAAHVVPTKSKQLRGLKMEILGVTGAVPGGKPTVTFRVTNGDGSFVNPADLASLNILVGGPTTEYTTYFRESARGATVAGDQATYTFTANAFPADASGTWTFSADCYRNVKINAGTEKEVTVRECAMNPIRYVAIGDTFAKPRRKVVSDEKCNACHDQLALHGGQRFAIEECLICHHPTKDDSAQRPADQGLPESVHMKRMIHRIHTGEELEQELTIYGHGKSRHEYNHVRYPGDRRNCEACHLPGTYGVPVPQGSIDTPTPRDWYTPQKPAAAACLGCHDNVDAAAHAWTNTAPFAEACAACHGSDRDFAVSKVHAR